LHILLKFTGNIRLDITSKKFAMKEKNLLLMVSITVANMLAAQRVGLNNDDQVAPKLFSWDNYSFVVPDKWFTNKTKDYINLSQSQAAAEGCLITILPLQASSGNLEVDARSVFDQMYPGWQYRNTGEKQFDFSKGYTQQGLEYFMVEAPMRKQRPDGYYYDYEDGVVWLIGVGKKVAIVAARHNRLLACTCFQQYDEWRRFFNSFNVNTQSVPTPNDPDASKRIIGSWMAIGSSALTEYLFAANGNYQFIGAYGSASTVTKNYDEYIQIKSSSWQGDGSYSIKGNQISLKGMGDKQPEHVQFRFEKVNHGGTGWNDRLFLLKTSAGDGKLYEVCYEKEKR
jgi:hypothetical protein